MPSKGKQIRSIPYIRSSSSATRACEPLAEASWRAQASHRSSPSWQAGQTRQASFWQHASLASLGTNRKPRILEMNLDDLLACFCMLTRRQRPCALPGKDPEEQGPWCAGCQGRAALGNRAGQAETHRQKSPQFDSSHA